MNGRSLIEWTVLDLPTIADPTIIGRIKEHPTFQVDYSVDNVDAVAAAHNNTYVSLPGKCKRNVLSLKTRFGNGERMR